MRSGPGPKRRMRMVPTMHQPRSMTGGRSGGTCRRPRPHWMPRTSSNTRRESPMAADAKVEALRGMSLFAGLRNRDLEQIAKLVDEIDRPAGFVLMREGEQGSQAFVLASGGALVERDGREIARVAPGQVIGEIALLAEGPRTASAT